MSTLRAALIGAMALMCMGLTAPLVVETVQLLVVGARPGNEFDLVRQLNGQPNRVVTADGGRSGAFNGASSAMACMPFAGLKNPMGAAVNANVWFFVTSTPGNFCIRPSINSPMWDGGCNATLPTDENFGIPAAVGVPQYFQQDSVATHFCFVGDAGTISAPAWWVY